MPASPALPALPHTQYTHTQSHNRRHGSRLGAGRRGWDAAEQRSRGRLAAAGRRVRVGEHAGLSGVATPLEPHPSAGGWQQQRRATRRSASRLHQGKGSARALHPAAGPALYKTGPVDCHRVPTSAPPGRKDGFYLHHDVEDVCRSDRRAAGVGEESAQGARSCDLEGNRAGLGCLEHLRNALSFAVVTEWPVGVYPHRRCRSPPHACLVRAVGQSSPCECMSGQNKD